MMTPTGASIGRYLDLVSMRQKLTAANVANAATPGYTTKDIDFQAEFQAELEKPLDQIPVIEADGLKARNDGNNVSLDREARMIAENTIRFNVATQLWKGQMRQLRSAIQEGRNG